MGKRKPFMQTCKIRPPKWPDLERALFHWYVTHRQDYGGKVTGPVLIEKAKWIWDCVVQDEDVDAPTFSNGWLDGFRDRYNINNINGPDNGNSSWVARARDWTSAQTFEEAYLPGDARLYIETRWFYPPKASIATSPSTATRAVSSSRAASTSTAPRPASPPSLWEATSPPIPQEAVSPPRAATPITLSTLPPMDFSQFIGGLRNDLSSSATSSVPECTTCEFTLRGDACVPLVQPAIGPYAEGGEQDIPTQFKQHLSTPGSIESIPDDHITQSAPRASVSSMLHIDDVASRRIVQRAASRAIVQHIEALDGFKYTFNNAWSAKDEDGLRFSYICQDSMQNKDRHANGFARTLKHLKSDGAVGERVGRKPTYDCKGSVSVKFSAKAGVVLVQYRHYAIHGTVAERNAVQAKPVQASQGPAPILKRKRSSDAGFVRYPYQGDLARGFPGTEPQRQLSLYELLLRSADANQQSGLPGDAQSPWWGST